MSANVNHNMLLKFCTVHMSANVNHNMLLRFCTVYLSADVDLPCVAMQVHIDDTCLNVFERVCWGQVVGYKDKVCADYFFFCKRYLQIL